MKAEARVLGFDDAPHTRADGRVPVIGVHMRGAHRVEGILLTDVERDGGDATSRVARCYLGSGLRGTKALLVDLDGLAQETGVPCIAFTVGVPDVEAMRRALRNVPDPEGKWALLQRRRNVTLPTGTTPVTVSFAGVGREEAIELLAVTTAHGLVPEPLRLAHMIAAVMR